MTVRKTPPPEILAYIRENILYEPDTGVLRRRSNGRRMGWLRPSGYMLLSFYRPGRCPLQLRAHCVCWFLAAGQWPPADRDVEHENRRRADNRLKNLSLKTRIENVWNQGAHRSNRLGLKGVGKTPSGRYKARLGRYGKYRYLGLFDDPHAAHAAYVAAGGIA